jgi:hypothetical protein
MFVEDPLLFLSDFSLPVVAGATQGVGILDMPGEYVLDDMQISTDYMLRCEASKFGALKYGDNVQVDTNYYTVRENRLVDDGLFCLISLSKLTAPPVIVGTAITTLGSLKITTLDGRYLVTL